MAEQSTAQTVDAVARKSLAAGLRRPLLLGGLLGILLSLPIVTV